MDYEMFDDLFKNKIVIMHKKQLKYTINNFFTYKSKKGDNYRNIFSYHHSISPHQLVFL